MACGRRTSSKRCQGKPSCWRTNRLKANSTTLHLLVWAGRIVAEQFKQAQKRVALWLKRWRKNSSELGWAALNLRSRQNRPWGLIPGSFFAQGKIRGRRFIQYASDADSAAAAAEEVPATRLPPQRRRCWQRGCRRSGGGVDSATAAAEEAPTARLPQRRRESTQASFGLSWHRTLQAINCHALTYYVMHEQKEEHTAQTAGCRAA